MKNSFGFKLLNKNKVTSRREATSLNRSKIMVYSIRENFFSFFLKIKNGNDRSRSEYGCLVWSWNTIWCSSKVNQLDLSFEWVLIFFFLSSDIKCRSGEFIIDTLSSVEDTKGNNGDKGKLTITNIRLIWHSHSSPRINLCMSNTFKFITIKSRSIFF